MERILVVDGQPLRRYVLLQTIAAAGYRVLEAASGAQAIRLIRSFRDPIHLSIIDQTLDDGKGMDVAMRMAAMKPGIRFIMVSGFAEKVPLAKPPRANFALEYLQTPFSPERLFAKMQQLLTPHEPDARAGV